jgi:hypothetical protein
MPKTLSSKRFFITKTGTIPLDRIKAWFDGIDRGSEDCALTVSVEAAGNKRTKKKTACRQLEELIADSIAENEETPVVWERYGYLFKFITRKYFWNGEEIHVTANEALFLYRRLVLGDDICRMQTYYLRNMRRRLGKEFLAETGE